MINLILDKIKQYQTIIIHRHTRPDGDCMGSQLGLKAILKKTYPNKHVYAVGEEAQEFYYLGRMDHISNEVYQDALVFILDVADIPRISDERFRLGKELIKIDHHPKRDQISPIEWIDTGFSSCCEMIVSFYDAYKDELVMTDKAAECLYYGMVTDTNRFMTPNITSRTFQLSALLRNYQFDLVDLYENIYNEPENITKLRCYVSEHCKITENGLAYMNIDLETCQKFNTDADISNVLVNTLGNIRGVEIFFVAIWDEKTGKVRISLRSKRLRINQYAEKYGGGGHKNASGLMVDDFAMAELLAKDLNLYLLEEIKNG